MNERTNEWKLEKDEENNNSVHLGGIKLKNGATSALALNEEEARDFIEAANAISSRLFNSDFPAVNSGAGWVGVDLDGTLAEYDRWRGVDHIGSPIPKMVNLIKKLISNNIEVRIFTARVSMDSQRPMAIPYIKKWCMDNIGVVLPITCIKDMKMIALFDDRAFHAVKNIGELLPEFDIRTLEAKQ